MASSQIKMFIAKSVAWLLLLAWLDSTAHYLLHLHFHPHLGCLLLRGRIGTRQNFYLVTPWRRNPTSNPSCGVAQWRQQRKRVQLGVSFHSCVTKACELYSGDCATLGYVQWCFCTLQICSIVLVIVALGYFLVWGHKLWPPEDKCTCVFRYWNNRSVWPLPLAMLGSSCSTYMRWQLGIGGFCRQNPEQNQRFLDMQQNSAAKGLDGAESGVWQFDADIKQCSRSYHVCITTHGIAQSVQYRPVA